MSDLRMIKKASDRVVLLARSEHSPVTIFGATILVFLVFTGLAPGTFPTSANMQSIGFQLPETALLGLGVMLSMVVAGIDLSVVAVADLSGVTMVEYFSAVGATTPGHGSALVVIGGIVIALAVGALCGMINGLLVGRLHITAILATLATMELFGGLAIAWTDGNTLQAVPRAILDIGNLSPAGIPLPAIILVGCGIFVALLLNGSRFGIRSILVGGNAHAAGLSGIREARVQMGIYTASGLLAAVAGVIIVGRTAGATPDFGAAAYVLLAVVIAVLAGVDPNGGFGTVVGVVLAAFVLNMIQAGFVGLGLNQFLYEVAQGGVLIVVLAGGAIVRGGNKRWSWISRLRPDARTRDTAKVPADSDSG